MSEYSGNRAGGLHLHCTDSLTVEVKQVVRETEAGLHGELALGDTAAGGQVQFIPILHEPDRNRNRLQRR